METVDILKYNNARYDIIRKICGALPDLENGIRKKETRSCGGSALRKKEVSPNRNTCRTTCAVARRQLRQIYDVAGSSDVTGGQLAGIGSEIIKGVLNKYIQSLYESC